MNVVSTVYTMMGFESGIVMRKNTCDLVAPSRYADSSRDFGIVSKNPFAI